MLRKFLAGVGVLSLVSVASLAPAGAADLAYKAPPPPPVYSWTGLYIGGNGGGAVSNNATSTAGVDVLGDVLTPGSALIHSEGWIGGIQAGYNWQVAPILVLGVETDFQLSGLNGSASCVVTCNQLLPPFAVLGVRFNQFDVNQNVDWFGTVRGRIGFSPGPALLYVTGGLAYGDVDRRTNAQGCFFVVVGGCTVGFGNFSGSFDHASTQVGWTVGAGAEAKLWGPWSAKVEYLYLDLGRTTDTFTETNFLFGPIANRTVTTDVRENIIRFGLNYQFNGLASP